MENILLFQVMLGAVGWISVSVNRQMKDTIICYYNVFILSQEKLNATRFVIYAGYFDRMLLLL